MTHTKGPWKRQSYRIFASKYSNAEYPIHAPKRGLIAKAFRESDANLISAAPDLYEQLENCVDLLAACFPNAPVDSCIGDAIAKGNAAIAKVTGEA